MSEAGAAADEWAGAGRVPTMRDVAERADVGLKTVSRFVNGETNIRPQLAERIARAIDDLGYRRNLAAASIRPGQQSRVLGLIIGDLGNPFWSGMARAAERVCAERRWLLLTASSEEDPDRFARLIDRLVEQRVDALMVVRPPGEELPALERAAGDVPVVAIDRPSEHAACNVLYDNAHGARAAVEILRTHGRVGYVGDTTGMWTMSERFRGYSEAVGAVDEEIVRHSAHTMEEAQKAAAELLDAGVDALFTANNRASVGALLAFAAAGRRVPMIGFDEFEAAKLANPPVSVANAAPEVLGRAAAEAAFSLLDGAAPPDVLLEPDLVLRGSEAR
ncbi:MAG: LacI family DNA-binding transcriptional regulator [Microbacterium sp.]